MSYLSPTGLYVGWVLRLIYFSVFALLACGTKPSLSTLTAIYGYLIVLFMSAVSGTLFQLLPNSEHKWAFHTLEKVDFRLVNLILYYFILQLLPLLIILNPEKKEYARIIKNRNRIRKYSNIFMIVAVLVSIALIAQSTYDYIYGQGTTLNRNNQCIRCKFQFRARFIYIYLTIWYLQKAQFLQTGGNYQINFIVGNIQIASSMNRQTLNTGNIAVLQKYFVLPGLLDGQPSNPNDPLIQSITSLRFEVIVSLIKFLMDIALAIIFIKIFMFYLKLKLISKAASNYPRLSPYNYCIIAITLITFIYESYYSVCYIVHRFFKLYQLENAPWYAPFRDVNAQIVDILRNFWTGMVILYMFDYIRRSQVEKEKTLLEVINTMKNEEIMLLYNEIKGIKHLMCFLIQPIVFEGLKFTEASDQVHQIGDQLIHRRSIKFNHYLQGMKIS